MPETQVRNAGNMGRLFLGRLRAGRRGARSIQPLVHLLWMLVIAAICAGYLTRSLEGSVYSEIAQWAMPVLFASLPVAFLGLLSWALLDTKLSGMRHAHAKPIAKGVGWLLLILGIVLVPLLARVLHPIILGFSDGNPFALTVVGYSFLCWAAIASLFCLFLCGWEMLRRSKQD
jgi:hypothetical protein